MDLTRSGDFTIAFEFGRNLAWSSRPVPQKRLWCNVWCLIHEVTLDDLENLDDYQGMRAFSILVRACTKVGSD